MKNFSHLKGFIEKTLEEKTYVEVDIEGVTFKKIDIDFDVNYDTIMENSDRFNINIDHLIIDGNGHSINLNHRSSAFSVSSQEVIIRNFKFQNGAASEGGAINNNGIVKVENCSFTNCKASRGGVIYNAGVLIVENSCFKDNRTTYHLGNGGAIFNEHLSLIFDSKFINNHSEQYGGAIFNGKTLRVDGCIFKENSARSYGGTIKNKGFFSFMDAVTVSFEGWDAIAGRACTIKNSVFEDAKFVIRSSADLDIENCVFRNNSDIISIHSSTVNIKDCLFEKNHSYLIENTYSTIIHSFVTIKNCDFINNKSDIMQDNALGEYYKSRLFRVDSDRKHWNIKNSRFENNASNYIFDFNYNNLALDDVSFEDNDFEFIFNHKCNKFDECGLKLNNVIFSEKLENIINCEGNLEINNCKFQKHHKINDESVFDVYKSEKKFLKILND